MKFNFLIHFNYLVIEACLFAVLPWNVNPVTLYKNLSYSVWLSLILLLMMSQRFNIVHRSEDWSVTKP